MFEAELTPRRLTMETAKPEVAASVGNKSTANILSDRLAGRLAFKHLYV